VVSARKDLIVTIEDDLKMPLMVSIRAKNLKSIFEIIPTGKPGHGLCTRLIIHKRKYMQSRGKMAKMDMEKIAHWAFVAFVIIAIVMGLIVGYMVNQSYSNTATVDSDVTLILLVLGIIVGLVKITAKEVTPFLIAAIALIAASISNVWSPLTTINALLYDWATYIVHYITAFVAPAAVIIAIKAVFAMERMKGSEPA
jgi:uncharacterized membrane protein